MSEYKHGVYGMVGAAGSRVAIAARNAIVYVGTAPVHTIEGGGNTLNKPIVVNNIADAKKIFGYSEDFAAYTLCEAMHAHLELNAVGPLVLINVLDPATHIADEGGSASPVPANGRAVIPSAENACIDSLVVKSGATTKVKGTDYSVAFDPVTKAITLTELTDGALGTTALTVTYNIIDPTAVDADDVIGETDGAGNNTGIYAIRNVYQMTGYIPAYLLAPGFSSLPAVHTAMIAAAKKIGGHWDAWVMADIPIVDSSAQAVTLATAATWKTTNGYNHENESVYFPMAAGTDGQKYHISVLAAANFQQLLAAQDGIPYKTASNTDCVLIENLYLGESAVGGVYDDDIINRCLNQHGINSAAYVGGRWAIWGAHAANYEFGGETPAGTAETAGMMLFYLTNDFQHRRAFDVDKPYSWNDIQSIVSAEQERLDALVKIGALLYGKITADAALTDRSDVVNGDFSFRFDVTTTPILKSLTAVVSHTDAGYEAFYEQFGA